MVLLSLLAYAGTDAAIAACDFRRTDDCYKKAIIVSQAQIDLRNEDHVNEACGIFLEAFECLHDFIKECLSPALQEVNKMLAAKSGQMLRHVCIQRNYDELKNLANTSCVEKVLAADDIKSHTEEFLDAMEKAKLAELSKKVPIFCCAVENLLNKTSEKLSTACRESDVKNSFSELPVSRLRDVFCQGFNAGLSHCTAGHSPSSRRQYGELRIVKSMSNFMEILITETFEISEDASW